MSGDFEEMFWRLVVFITIVISSKIVLSADQWEKTNGPYGANISCVYPISQSEILVGTKYSGLYYYNIDQGKWEKVFYDNLYIGINSIIKLENNSIFIEATSNSDNFLTIILLSNGDLNQWEFVSESIQGKFVLLHDSANEYLFKLLGRTLGIIRSSDNGNSWASSGPETYFIEDILADTVNNLLYASSNSIIVDPLSKSSSSTGVFVSTDYGNSWNTLFEESSDKIFSNNTGLLVSSSWSFAEWYKSNNYGNSWEQLSNQPPLLELSFLDMDVFGGGSSGLYRSNLDFESWEQLLQNIEINCIQSISNNRFIIGSINDIIVFNPQLNSFESIAEGLYEKQFFKILQTRDGNIFTIGFSGGLYKSDDEGNNWKRISQFFNGFEYGYYNGFQPERQIYDLAEDGNGNLYSAATVDDRFFYSKDKGLSWDYILLYTISHGRMLSLAVDSTNYVYLGFHNGVGRYNPDSNELTSTALRGVSTTAITVDKDNVVYAGSLSGRVYKTTDQGNFWSMVGNDTDTSTVNNIIVSDNVYLSTYKGIYKLSNNQWNRIHGDLPEFGIVNHSAYKDGVLYVSLAELGIYYTIDSGNHWIKYFDGIDNLEYDKLLITTNGSLLTTTNSGVFKNNLILSSVEETKSDFTKFELKTGSYPNPFNNITNLQFSISEKAKVIIRVYDILGHQIAELTKDEFGAGKYSVPFDAANLTSGVYIYAIRAGKLTQSGKMLLMK